MTVPVALGKSIGVCDDGYLGYPSPRWTGKSCIFVGPADGGEYFPFFFLFFPSTGSSDLEATF